MNGSASNHYQKYTWLCVGATAVALLVSAAAFSAKEERAAAQARPAQSHQAVQGQPEKNLTEYYTPNAAASQENSGETPSQEESYLVTVYDGKIGVFREGEDPSFGAIFFADVWETGALPADSEVAECRLMDALPEELTRPELQPALFEQVRQWLEEGNFRSVQEDIFELMM